MFRKIAALTFAVALLGAGGCRTTAPPARESPPEHEGLRTVAEAESKTQAAERANLYLQALAAFRDRGEFEDAADIIDRLATPQTADGEPLAGTLTASSRFRFHAIVLEMALVTGDDETELERLLEALRPVDAGQRLVAERLRAKVLIRTSGLDATFALMATAERWLGDDGFAALTPDVPEISAAIWRQLSELSIPALATLAKSAPSASAQEWLRLAESFNAAFTGREQARVWRRWQATHPQHVAARFPPPSVAQSSREPRRLALLLPLTGALATAAEAVRDGFAAAYLFTEPRPGAGDSPIMRIYDTGAMSVGEAYRRAHADGAEIIVGPLEKSSVAELVAQSPTLPVVALNEVDQGMNVGADFLQLALAVEDDASAVAAALAEDGVERVVLFDNPQRWAARARERFEEELGTTVEVVASGTLRGVADATEVAADVLRVTASNARHAALSQLTGLELAFTARRRDDVDAVVAFVEGGQLMALKPALDFHFAADLPVYAPSRAVRGVSWRRLDGVRVCDIPWRLHPHPLRAAATSLSTNSGTLASFFALGVDGFRIANQRFRLLTYGEAIAGSTGLLTLADNGRIRRRLARGEVVNGNLLATPIR